MIAMWRRRPKPPVAPPEPVEPIEQVLRRLEWVARRSLATRLGGDRPSNVRGSGLDLAELREYQPGDDVRLIDASATARTGLPHVRQAYAERALDVWLLIDVSPSVEWGTARRTKRSHAEDLVAAVAGVLGRHHSRIGAITFAERPTGVLAPAVGRHHLLRLLAKLREAPRRLEPGRTDLAAALDLARTVIRRPSVVLVVSDLLVMDGWETALGKLAARHEVAVVRLVDPREGEIPDVGIVTFEDPETGEQLIVDTSDRRLRDRFAASARAQSEQIDRSLTERGVRRVVASTDSDLIPTLLELMDPRRQIVARRRLASTPR